MYFKKIFLLVFVVASMSPSQFLKKKLENVQKKYETLKEIFFPMPKINSLNQSLDCHKEFKGNPIILKHIKGIEVESLQSGPSIVLEQEDRKSIGLWEILFEVNSEKEEKLTLKINIYNHPNYFNEKLNLLALHDVFDIFLQKGSAEFISNSSDEEMHEIFRKIFGKNISQMTVKNFILELKKIEDKNVKPRGLKKIKEMIFGSCCKKKSATIKMKPKAE